jgi:hypothetical protein
MLEASDLRLKLNTSRPRKMMGKFMERIGPKPGDGPKAERLDGLTPLNLKQLTKLVIRLLQPLPVKLSLATSQLPISSAK